MIWGAAIAAGAAVAGAMSHRSGNGLSDPFGERYRNGWSDPKKYPPYPFPRSRQTQEARMTRFMEWRRTQIDIRLKRRVKFVALIALGTPLSIIALAFLWRLAVFMVVS